MEVRFFGRDVENPLVKFLVALGAAVFAAALVAAVLIILLPVLGAVLTGVLLIVAVVLVLVLVFLPFVAFIGVVFSRGEKGSGVLRTEIRELDPFTSVKTSGNAVVSIQCGGEQSVEVTTDDNLLDNAETTVSGGELSVSWRKSVVSGSTLRVKISVPELNKLRTYGAATVEITEVDSKQLIVKGSGAAKVTASGKAEKLTLRISGAGKMNCSELKAVNADATVSGAGKIRVSATGSLKARVSGAGKILYTGNPETVDRKVSGAGKIQAF